MPGPSEFFIDLGVEFSYDKVKLQSLTKEVKLLMEKESKIELVNSENIDEVKKLYKTMFADLTVAYDKYLKAQQSGTQSVAKQAATEIQVIQKLIESLYSKAKSGKSNFKGSLTTSVKEYQTAIKQLIVDSEQYDKQIRQSATETANFDKAVRQTTSGLERQQISADKISEKMESLNQQLIKLEASYKNGSITTEQYRTRLQQLSDRYTRLSEQEKNVQTNVDKLKNSFKDVHGNLDGVSQAVQTCDTKMENLKETSNLTRQHVDKLSLSLDNRTGLSKWLGEFKEGFKQGIGQISGAALGLQAFQTACQFAQQAISAIVSEAKELNKAMTDVQMVAGTTTSETTQMFKEYNQLAKDLSVTTKDVAAGAGEWLRQGRSQAETLDLIKASTVQATLAQMDYSTSSELLTSTLNGYKMEVEDVMHIVDALVQVDFKAATSVQELATALQKTANTARISGIDFERLVGYLGAVSEATRQAPELIGRSFKTMLARMQSVAAGAEFDEAGEAINDVEEVLTKLGIRLRENNDTFRDMSDVLDDIASKWDTFSDAQRQQISNAVAGKNQMEIFIALMENYDKALYLEEEALNSSGAAMERYGIYQDSIAAKQAELKAQFEEFAYSESVTDLIKSFFELGKALIYLAEALKPVIDLLSTTITVVSTLVGGIIEFVGAIVNLDGDYFKKLFGKDTETNIKNTEERIAGIKEQIDLLNDSDIDIDVKQEELNKLKEALKEANEELEKLREDKRNEGYSSTVSQYYYIGLEGGSEKQTEQEVSLKNINDLYAEATQRVKELTEKKTNLNKKNKEEYTTNERMLGSAKKNVKAYEDWIVETYSQIRATQELFDETGRLSDSLTDEERNLVLLVHSSVDLLNAYHEITNSSNEAGNSIRNTANAEAEASSETNLLYNQIKDLNDIVNKLDSEMAVVNKAMEEFQTEGGLTAQTALDLMEANMDYADALEFVGGRITLNIDKLQQQAKQAITTAKTNVIAASAMAEAWAEATKEAQKAGSGLADSSAHWQNVKDEIYGNYDHDLFLKLENLLSGYEYGKPGSVSNYRPPSSSGSSDKDKDKDTSDEDAERELREQQKAYLDALKERQNAFKAYLDAILRIFDKEKEALEKQKDEWEKYYDDKIDAIKEQEKLEDQELERQEKLLEIEKLRAELAKANQQVVRVYVRGQGFVYRQDTEAIAAAQDKLNVALKEYEEWQKKLDRDKEIKDLEDAKDKVLKDLDEQIDKLGELADKWKESLDITEDTTTYKDLLDDMAKFEKANLDERLKYLDDFTKAYMDLINKINAANQIGNSGSNWGSIGGGSGSGSITQIGGSGGSGGTSTGKPGETIYTNSFGSSVKHTSGSGPGLIFDGELGLIYNADGTNAGDKYGKTIWETLGIEEPKESYDLHGGIQSWFLDNWGWNPLEGSSPNNIKVMGKPLGSVSGVNKDTKPTTSSGGSSSSSNKNPDTGWSKDDYKDWQDTKDDSGYSPTDKSNIATGTGPNSSKKPSGADRADQIEANRDKNRYPSSSSGNKPSTKPGTVEDLWYSARGRKNVSSDHFSIVGEEGPELRVLNQGDGIVPADATENLMNWGMFSPAEFMSRIRDIEFTERSVGGGDIYNMNFDSIVLPDVNDFESFKEALMSNSKNYAVQIQTSRT